MPEIEIRLPEKMGILFQDFILDANGEPIIDRDPLGNMLYEVETKIVDNELIEELILDDQGQMIPRKMRVRNVYIRGGRGGGKSMGMGEFVPMDMLTRGHTWLFGREIQDSIKKSSYKEFQDGAEHSGVQNYFKFKDDVIECKENGAVVLFSGLRYMSNNIKSIKGIDRVWIEEADTTSDESIKKLTPTIRKPGSRLIWTYNPNHDFDPVHILALNPGPRDLSVAINWRDNPWFPDELRYEMEEMRKNNFRKYLNVYEGMTQEESGSTTFDPKWFLNRWRNLKTIRGNCFILFDPANSEHKKSDFTAWAVWYLDYDKNKYLVEVARDRLVGVEKWDKLVEIHRRHKKIANSVTVGWERYGAQSDISFFKTRMEEVGYRFPIKELGGSMKKTDRIGRLANPMSTGNVYLPVAFEYKRKDGIVEDGVKVLINELSMHPHVPKDVHDDVSDVASRIEDPELNAQFPEGPYSGYEEDEWGNPMPVRTIRDRTWEI